MEKVLIKEILVPVGCDIKCRTWDLGFVVGWDSLFSKAGVFLINWL